MRGLLWGIFVFTFVQLAWSTEIETFAHPGRKVVCYFGSWSVYRPEIGKFDVESIDPYLCTHLMFSFTGLRNGVMVALDPYNDKCEEWGKGALVRFNKLKEINPRLRTMVAIGGWNEGSSAYSNMSKTFESRQKFIKSVVDFLQAYEFDGFDLDWEYPANRGGVPQDKENFGLLVKEFREEFDKHGYLLSAAVSAGEPTIKSAYDVPTISRYLDFINVMAYDYRGAWDMKSGHHAPLYKNPLDTGIFETYNMNHSINFWISSGAHPEKLVLGMGMYGRGVRLDKESENGLYAPGGQPLPAGPYLRDAGYWGYNEICEELQKGDWTVVVDEYYKAPYAYKGRLWVGYDDIQSIKLKSEFILKYGLGGGMVWSLDTDDFQGKCHGERFPLIKTIYRTVIGKYPKYEWEPKPSRSSSKEACADLESSTTTPDNEDVTSSESVSISTPISAATPTIECKSEGLNADLYDCTKFYNCVRDGESYKAFPLQCGPGTAFNPESKTCAHAVDVPQCTVKSITFHRQQHL